jgi:hypothetical protein
MSSFDLPTEKSEGPLEKGGLKTNSFDPRTENPEAPLKKGEL